MSAMGKKQVLSRCLFDQWAVFLLPALHIHPDGTSSQPKAIWCFHEHLGLFIGLWPAIVILLDMLRKAAVIYECKGFTFSEHKSGSIKKSALQALIDFTWTYVTWIHFSSVWQVPVKDLLCPKEVTMGNKDERETILPQEAEDPPPPPSPILPGTWWAFNAGSIFFIYYRDTYR